MDRISRLCRAFGVVAVITGSILLAAAPAALAAGPGDEQGSVRITDDVVDNRDF